MLESKEATAFCKHLAWCNWRSNVSSKDMNLAWSQEWGGNLNLINRMMIMKTWMILMTTRMMTTMQWQNTGNSKKMHYVVLQSHQPDSLRVGESYEGKMIAGKCLWVRKGTKSYFQELIAQHQDTDTVNSSCMFSYNTLLVLFLYNRYLKARQSKPFSVFLLQNSKINRNTITKHHKVYHVPCPFSINSSSVLTRNANNKGRS